MVFNTFAATSNMAAMSAEASFAKPSAPLPSVDANRDFSGTNNQVASVD